MNKDYHTDIIDSNKKQRDDLTKDLRSAKGKKKRTIKSQLRKLRRSTASNTRKHDRHIKKETRRDDRNENRENRRATRNERLENRNDRLEYAYSQGIDPTKNALQGWTGILDSVGNTATNLVGGVNDSKNGYQVGEGGTAKSNNILLMVILAFGAFFMFNDKK